MNEDVVSHELLHALFIKKGFGFSRANAIGNLPFQRISELLHSVIEHKSIYEIQRHMEIDIVQGQKHKASTIFMNIEKEPPDITYDTIVSSLLLLDCLVGAKEYKDLYIERVRKCFNKTYELARTLQRELFSESISDHVTFRRKFITALRICDKLLSKHLPGSNQFFRLTENISISFIPTKHELLLKSEQVFSFKEVVNSLIIISQKDNQASYILQKPFNIDVLKIMTVVDLIGQIDNLYSIRPDKVNG